MKLNLEKYDKIIWRINGTLLLLACLGSLLVCFVVGFKIIREELGPGQKTHDLVNVNQETKKEEFLTLGYFSPLQGTPYILVPLTSEQKLDVSYSSKTSYGSARNYLVFNSKTKESFWIWNSNSFIVLRHTLVYQSSGDEKNRKVLGIVFEFVSDNKNSKSIQYFDLASRKVASVIQNIDRAIGVEQSSDDEVLFFYARNGKSFFKSLNVSSFLLSDEKEIGLPLK